MKSRRAPLTGLLSAVGISTLGTRMTFLAIPWFVLTTTGSATMTGVIAFAEMGPYVTVQALGGPFVDRLGAKRVSVATDLVAALAIGAVPILHGQGDLSIPLLGVLVCVGGSARGAGDAARDVLVPGVTEIAETILERSSGLFDGVSRLASLIGLPVAGGLVVLISATNVLALDAATFVLSALLVALMVPLRAQPPKSSESPGDAEASYLASLRAGLRFLRGDRLLLGIAVMVLVTNFVDQAGGAVLFPVWAERIMHSAADLGLLGGAFSLAAFAGNGLTTWLAPHLPRRLTYGVGFLLAGAPRYLAVAFISGLAPILVIAFLSGLGAGGINPILGAVEYERVPRHLQARVLGTLGALAYAGIPFGSLVGGAAVSAIGLRTSLVIAAGVYAVTTLSPFVFPAWRGMRRDAGSHPWATRGDGGGRDVTCPESLRGEA